MLGPHARSGGPDRAWPGSRGPPCILGADLTPASAATGFGIPTMMLTQSRQADPQGLTLAQSHRAGRVRIGSLPEPVLVPDPTFAALRSSPSPPEKDVLSVVCDQEPVLGASRVTLALA